MIENGYKRGTRNDFIADLSGPIDRTYKKRRGDSRWCHRFRAYIPSYWTCNIGHQKQCPSSFSDRSGRRERFHAEPRFCETIEEACPHRPTYTHTLSCMNSLTCAPLKITKKFPTFGKSTLFLSITPIFKPLRSLWISLTRYYTVVEEPQCFPFLKIAPPLVRARVQSWTESCTFACTKGTDQNALFSWKEVSGTVSRG